MNRAAYTWLAFACCVAVAAGVMAWVTAEVLDLERAERQARSDAATAEATRLALWRMDSLLFPLVYGEVAQPPEAYNAIGQPAPGFVAGPYDPYIVSRLPVLDSDDDAWRRSLFAALGEERLDVPAQQFSAEWTARQASNQISVSNAMTQMQNVLPARTPVASVRMLWVDADLALVKALGDGSRFVTRLKWSEMRPWLEEQVSDLLPSATLAPVEGDAQPFAALLTAIPAQLVSGPASVEGDETQGILRAALLVAWVCAVASVLAAGLLLHGALALSKRRLAFASAVTHELRTPLTTFQLYSGLLAQDRVSDPDKRRRYLETLHSESQRLAHLVANVLSFARLESSTAALNLEPVPLQRLLADNAERLERIAAAADVALRMPQADGVGETLVEADRVSVEHILVNLVDNACKYSGNGGGAAVTVSVEAHDGRVGIRVCDNGPGVPPSLRRRLFRPFRRSASDAAGAAPGVGLGLAISRRLARRMGGDLVLAENGPDGACFELRLRPHAPPD